MYWIWPDSPNLVCLINEKYLKMSRKNYILEFSEFLENKSYVV